MAVEPIAHPGRAAGRGAVLAGGAGGRLRGARGPGRDRRPTARWSRAGSRAETRQVLANIAAVLGDCGVGWADVARTRIFLTDLGNFAAVNALYEGAIGAHRPARTTVGRRGPARGRPGGDRVLGVRLPEGVRDERPG